MKKLIMLCALLFAAEAAAQSPVVPIARQIEVEPGVRLEVLDWGGSGRAIVLLGGYGRTAHDFTTFGPALAAHYRVFSITRRGFGESSKPPSGYSADRLADDVLAVIDSLDLASPIVAAHSLGGEELSSIGSRHPDEVGGLVYLDAGYGYAFYNEQDWSNRQFVDMNEVTRGLRDLTRSLESGRAEHVHQLVDRLLSTDLPALRETLERVQATTPRVSENPPRGFAMRLSDGVDRMMFEGLQRFTRVQAPVLAIYALKGTTDTAVVNAWLTGRRPEIMALKRAAPHARVVIYPEASHDVFRSREQDVIREMREFIAELPEAPATKR